MCWGVTPDRLRAGLLRDALMWPTQQCAVMILTALHAFSILCGSRPPGPWAAGGRVQLRAGGEPLFTSCDRPSTRVQAGGMLLAALRRHQSGKALQVCPWGLLKAGWGLQVEERPGNRGVGFCPR